MIQPSPPTASPPPLLSVRDLSISFRTDDGVVRAVDQISFDVHKGEILGLVGESGSGKTVTGMSLLRLVPSPPGQIQSGHILFEGRDLARLPTEALRSIRGREIGVIFQEPMTALSPLHPVGRQLVEAQQLHDPRLPHAKAWTHAIEWLERVGIADAEERARAYAHQFSGGMRQRVMIAMTLMLNPKLIIADEPTTALDVTIQKQIFELILQMKRRDTALLFITHDMGVIWELCDRVLVMKDARIVESGTAETIFNRPEIPYTRKLLDAVPRLTDPSRPPATEQADVPLLAARDVCTWFPVRRGIFARTTGYIKAVDGVSLTIPPGQVFGLVGESGSGKTTLGRTILGLDPMRSGVLHYRGQPLNPNSSRAMYPYRRHLQMIFQDPFSSLNPRLNICDLLTEGPALHGLLQGEKEELAAHWLEEVGLAADMMNRYPHEFSGGQRQRICVARAMAVQPDFIVCDEAVSALDVTVQAQIIDLLMALKDKYNLSYLFISHDLSVIKRIADHVAVMRHGRFVEEGHPNEVIGAPQHPYTRQLIAAVPVPGDPARRQRLAART